MRPTRWKRSRHDQDVGAQVQRLPPVALLHQRVEASPGLYIWMAERGIYRNQAGSRVEDWMYWWWNAPAQNGDAGPLPEAGSGVPEERSWTYRVPYRSLDASRRASRSK